MGLAIEATGLHRRFGAVQALRGVDLAVGVGGIHGLVGPDAAGKTTLVRALAGLLVPDAGQVRVLGRHPDEAREHLGLMPQQFSLYGDLSVIENLRFFGQLFVLPTKVWRERVDRLLAMARLDRFEDRRADALSGGMYKKLALCCALLHEPELLLLDEPTNGVDPVSRRELWELLHALADGGKTVLVSTPYMDEAERCHKVTVLHHGKVLAEGDPVKLARGHGSFEDFFLEACASAPELARGGA
jgi:ABC-2 type transport system ATP-binding protein